MALSITHAFVTVQLDDTDDTVVQPSDWNDNHTISGTLADFNAALTDADFASVAYVESVYVPTGAVIPFAMNSVPAGWLACDGAAVSRSTYAALFTAISTTYGVGNGTTTFNVPDLRGLFIRGLGTTGTHAAAALGTLQEDDLEAHTHTQYTNSGAGSGPIVGGGAFGALNATTSSTGGTETRPANYGMLYCIKF